MKNYPITATFLDEVTYDITGQKWTNEQWIKDLDNMVDVGIDTVCIMRSVFYDKILYPSKYFTDKKKDYDDFLDLIFREAEKRNLKVFLGLHIANLTWNDGDYEYELKMNKIFIEEIMPMYSKYKSFYGWYIPHETGHNAYNIIPTMKGLIELIRQYTPEKKILISPFFRGEGQYLDYPPRLTPAQTFTTWDEMFTKIGPIIDYCAFQDGTCFLNQLDDYFANAKKACDKHGVELWGNVETFSRDYGDKFPPQDFDVIKKKIEIEQKHCKKLITFEFSHFLSPQSMYEKARENNKSYKEYYK